MNVAPSLHSTSSHSLLVFIIQLMGPSSSPEQHFDDNRPLTYNHGRPAAENARTRDTQVQAPAPSIQDAADSRETLEIDIKETKNDRPYAHGYKRSWIYDWWLWELLGIVLSLSVTTAIIVILAIYDGRPVPKWPYSITLNAMISIFSTIAKVCRSLNPSVS